MMKTMKTLMMSLALSAMMCVPALRAEEAPVAPAAPAEMTQADVALILVQRLGLTVGGARPPTAQEAAKLLLENGISPFAGWQLDQPLLDADAARMLVQAMKRQSEIPEEERNNPETTAYNDFLVREYNLDLAAIRQSLLDARRIANAQGSGDSGTDPLTRRPVDPTENPSGSSGFFTVPLNVLVFETALQTIVPVRGSGSGGQVDGDTDNATPSAPVPVPTPVPSPLPSPGPTPT
jgi:hypothetical protein